MLSQIPIPGLFITGTDTGVGKTVIAAAIAGWFARRGARIAVCKPIATGCEYRREGLVSPDAEWLAYQSNTRFPLTTICPQRYAEPLAPAIAAERADQPVEWIAIQQAISSMCEQSDFIIVEGVGGVIVPLDREITVLEMMRWLALPVVIVARAGLGTINHTLLTAAAIRTAGLPLAGVVINGYPSETPSPAEETNPQAIERWGKVPILCVAPLCPGLAPPEIPDDLAAAIETIDWAEKSRSAMYVR